MIVNILHKLRSLVPDQKTTSANISTCIYDDDYYINVIRMHNLNPNAMASSASLEQYDAMVLEVWYRISGDMSAVRKLEEIGVLRDSFNAQAKIRSLLTKDSELQSEVYDGVRLP